MLTAAMPDWLRAASISDVAEAPSTARSLLPPLSCSCIWKPLDTPRPGIAGGISGKVTPDSTTASRRRTSATIVRWSRPAFSRSAKGA